MLLGGHLASILEGDGDLGTVGTPDEIEVNVRLRDAALGNGKAVSDAGTKQNEVALLTFVTTFAVLQSKRAALYVDQLVVVDHARADVHPFVKIGFHRQSDIGVDERCVHRFLP